MLAPTYCDNDTHSHTFYSESREASVQRLDYFVIFHILLNILIITKSFIMFQVLM